LKGWAITTLAAGVLISTWVGHQYVITGQPKLFFGAELWLAFATQYDNGGGVYPIERLPYFDKFARELDGTVAGKLRGFKVLQTESMKIIRRDPAKYLLFGFTRMKNILWSAQTGILWTTKESQIFRAPPKTVRHLTEFANSFWRVLLLSCIPLGLLASFRTFSPFSRESQARFGEHQTTPAREGQILLWLYVLFWLVFHFLFSVASERYAFQLIPFILMFFSAGICNLIMSFPRQRESI